MQIRNWISFAGTSNNSPARFRTTSTPQSSVGLVAGLHEAGESVELSSVGFDRTRAHSPLKAKNFHGHGRLMMCELE